MSRMVAVLVGLGLGGTQCAPSAPPPPDRLPVPAVSTTPDTARPGEFLQVVIRPASDDSLSGVEAELDGMALWVEEDEGARSAPVPAPLPSYRALGAVPVRATDSVMLVVVLHRPGIADTSRHTIRLGTTNPPVEQIRVAPRFSSPLSPELAERTRRELESARAVGRESFDTPRLWEGPFVIPVSGQVTSPYGVRREFNGELRSRHLGTDLRGNVGTPVRAPSRGVVRLTGDFYYGGNVVYLDHGRGLTTAYLHLSKIEVAVGDTVEVGTLIGRVGATGRVTGAHLHWIARFGEESVDAMSFNAAVGP